MKRNILLIASLCFWANTYAQDSTNEKEAKALRVKCKVKSVTTLQSDYKTMNGKLTLGPQVKVSKNGYDKKGELAEEITYNKRGTVETWIVYKNTKQGTEYINYNPNGSVHHTSFSVNKNDSLGRMELSLLYTSDSVQTHKIQYFYDDKGNMIQMETYVVDGKKAYLDSYVKYDYDARGRTIKEEYYDNANNYKGRVEYKYDSNGRLTEKIDYYAYKYKYAPDGIQTECTSYGGANGEKPVSLYKNVYEYYK